MFRHTMEFNINKQRHHYKEGSKVRIWKLQSGSCMVVTVVDGHEGFPFVIDSYDVPNIIRSNGEGDIEELIKEFSKLPISA